MNRKNGELVLCSYGLVPRHITMETIMELKSCDEVFSDALDEHTSEFLGQYCRKINAVKTARLKKKAGEDVLDKYAGMVTDALARGRKVGVVTYGHPGFLCSIADRLIEKCESSGFNYRIIDSISSINCVLNMVGLRSLFPAGIFMSSAIGWARESVKFHPGLHNLIFDLVNLIREERREVLEAFVRAARKELPAGHNILLVEAPSMSDSAGKIVRTTPLKLKSTVEISTDRSTLYIPAI